MQEIARELVAEGRNWSVTLRIMTSGSSPQLSLVIAAYNDWVALETCLAAADSGTLRSLKWSSSMTAARPWHRRPLLARTGKSSYG